MKIVQSFWTKPYLEADPLHSSGLNAGWPHRMIHYASWALSCLQLRKYYDAVELVTDTLGKEILIDRLKLPYTSVSVALDDLENVDLRFWVLGKMYTYGLQKEPFLHVDGDIFIFGPFHDHIVNASLAAQNLDQHYPGYEGKCRPIWDCLTYVPEYLKQVYQTRIAHCCNAGILGGKDIPFIRAFVDEAFSFLENNRQALIEGGDQIDWLLFNVLLEQGIVYHYAGYCQKEITYLFPEDKVNPPEIGFFHSAAKNKDYVHCYGFYKGLRTSYSRLELMLKSAYPVYYRRIHELVSMAEI